MEQTKVVGFGGSRSRLFWFVAAKKSQFVCSHVGTFDP